METIKKHLNFIGNVLSNWKYLLLFVITSLIGFAIMYKLTMINVANESIKIFILMSGVNYTFLDLFISAIISILFGLLAVLFIYKFNLVRKTSKVGFLGALGVVIGLFAAGCPTCGAFLFALIGFPLALMYLPWGGMELKLLSIIFLLLSNYLIIQGMLGCKIKKGILIVK